MQLGVREVDQFAINLIRNGGEELHASVTLFDISMIFPFRESCRVTIKCKEVNCSADGYCFFGALLSLRRDHLEPQGFLPQVNGASIDCYPSNMASEMGQGKKIYKLTMGQKMDVAQLVNTFECDAISTLVEVSVQQEYYKEWYSHFRNA